MGVLANILDRQFIKRPKFRRALTRALYGARDCTIDLLGAELLINCIEENGYLRAAAKSKFVSVFRDETSVLINLASLVDGRTVFVDIGANAGLHSSVIARLGALHPGLKVIAFEVNPATFARLEKNAARNGFECRCLGVSNSAGARTFITGAVSHVTSEVRDRNAYHIPGAVFEQICRPLSECELPAGDLVMKIDVEGQEFEVLEGAARYFLESRVKAIYVDGYSDTRVVEFVKNFGFSIFDGRTLRPAEHPVFSLLAVKQENAR